MIDNIEYSKEWLYKKYIEAIFESKKTGKEKIINIKESDLYDLVYKFVCLNEKDYE